MEDDIRYSVAIDSFVYDDDTRALTSIDLRVDAGEFIGILGSNGSGKTTLLKAMDGLIKNYKGLILLDGKDIKKMSPKQIYKKVGLVFQNPDDQLFAANVYEDVAFGPRNMGFGEADVRLRVENALDNVDMGGAAEKSINNLSYGQKKRVCIAGLLAMGHGTLLLDEPTAGLDPMGEYKMMQLLKKLNQENKVTIVMATHSVDMVPLFLDRLFILSAGKLVRGGTPQEVFTAPEDMADVKLRLPHIAEMIHKLRFEDNLPFSRTPLTIGEARREILRLIESRNDGGLLI
jgi:cobalt/nickel transport system ATP-binding protein